MFFTKAYQKRMNFKSNYIQWYFVLILSLLVSDGILVAQTKSNVTIGRVKYGGGGDWYNDPSSEVNLLQYIRKNTNVAVNPMYEFVDLSTQNIFGYPILFLTGHGNVTFTDAEVQRLRAYLQNGGFLYIDDDYGLDESIRREMAKVFSDQKFLELPFDHPIFSTHFVFANGVPKIHEHDNKPPQTFGLFDKGRLCVLYTYESNPSDGWADPDVHNTPAERREQALKFGTNIVVWALKNRTN